MPQKAAITLVNIVLAAIGSIELTAAESVRANTTVPRFIGKAKNISLAFLLCKKLRFITVKVAATTKEITHTIIRVSVTL